jgi:hypothetical protein
MRIRNNSVVWLAWAVFLAFRASSCYCYQSSLPISGLGNSRTSGPLLSLPSIPYFRKRKDDSNHRPSRTKRPSQQTRKSQNLLITKSYFENLERQSGKDYRWLKPIPPPVSKLMLYVWYEQVFRNCNLQCALTAHFNLILQKGYETT